MYIRKKKGIFLYLNSFPLNFSWSMCPFVRRKTVKPPVLHAVSVAEKRDNEIAIVVSTIFFFFFKYFLAFLIQFLWLVPHLGFVQAPARYFFHFFPFGSHRVVYLRLEVCLASTHSRMPCRLHFVAENSVQANEIIKRIDILTREWNQISLNLYTYVCVCVCFCGF